MRFSASARLSLIVAVLFSAILASPPSARAAAFEVVTATISGDSPDRLGRWNVRYQRVAGGDRVVADRINEQLDAHANSEVQRATWDGSTKRPWTFDADGNLRIGATTASEVFVGQYNTAEPHMPVQSVTSIVCDSRTGNRITWDNVFTDKRAGFIRLGDATAAALAATAAPHRLRDWIRQGQLAPVDINFTAWRPTSEGLELHFPEYQFGAGLKMVVVPWATVDDLIRPETTFITQG